MNSDIINADTAANFFHAYKRLYGNKRWKKRRSMRAIWNKPCGMPETWTYYLQVFVDGKIKQNDQISMEAYAMFAKRYPEDIMKDMSIVELPLN
jgi:hypothetical protein